MGQPIYNCPDPTGYYDRAEAWMDSGVLTSRWDYAWDMVRGGGQGRARCPDDFLQVRGDEPRRAVTRWSHD